MLTGYTPQDFLPHYAPFLIVLNTKSIPILQRGVNMPSELAKIIDYALIDNPEVMVQTAP